MLTVPMTALQGKQSLGIHRCECIDCSPEEAAGEASGPWGHLLDELFESGGVLTLPGRSAVMPLFEVETDAHIIITWAEDEANANQVVRDAYPGDQVIRMTKRPRDTWVISKGALGLTESFDPCGVARDCLSKAAGDKVHAIRLYMHETGADLESARKVIESNMVMGW
jgi:hypothetical protein